MLALLALLSCSSESPTPDTPPIAETSPTPPPVRTTPVSTILAEPEPWTELPTGRATVRDCYGSEEIRALPPRKAPSAALGGEQKPKGTAGPDTRPEVRSEVREQEKSAFPADASYNGAPASAPAASAEAPATPTPSEPKAGARGAVEDRSGGGDAARSVAQKPKKERGRDADVSSGAAPPPPDRDKPSSPEAYLDWGAKVYLSNDDSMSLASAQHLLHAVQDGHSFTANEVRPHELLNYFSFDTADVAWGELFSVQASAEKTGPETLTVALAVHGATPPRRPLDVTLVVDRSGSMKAEGRMEYVKRGLARMTDQLQRGDRVDLVLFDSEVCTPLEDYVVGRDDPSLLTDAISRMAPRGGTDIGIGLREAYRIVAEPARDQGIRRNRRVMLLTDAGANQGLTDKDALAMVGEAYENKGVRLGAVGVGVGFRDDLLDEVTEKGKGAYVYLGSEAVTDRVFGPWGFSSLTQTIAHDVQFELDLPDTLAMQKFYGEEASTDAADVQPIHYYAGTTQLFLQDLHVKPGDVSPTDPVTLTIRYRDAATGEPGEHVFHSTIGAMLDGDRHNLDKARTLMAWTDMLTAKAMGGDPCAAPATTYVERAGKVAGDAEVAYVNGLVRSWCPAVNLPTSVSGGGTVAYKVKVNSDVPIAEVELACGATRFEQPLGGADTVARFDAPPGAACDVVLQGAVPMTARVKVPGTGGDVRCMVRAGRMTCG